MSSDQTTPVGEAETAAGLPLLIVEREEDRAGSSRSVGSLGVLSRALGICGLVGMSLAVGAVIGLYRQPAPLQYVMTILSLEPGGGSADPIAVPVKRPPLPPSNNVGKVSADRQPSKTSRFIAGLGKILPKGDVRIVGVPSEIQNPRLAMLNVDVGDKVQVNQVLAVLDNEPRLKAAVDSARTTVRLRRAQLEQVKAVTRWSEDEARASVQSAIAKARNAKLDLERTRTLLTKKITAQSTYDLKLSTYEQAARDIDRARATLARYTSKTIDEQADVLVAAAQLEAAKTEVAKAVAELGKAYVRAPITGTVLEVHVRAGEAPGSDGVVDIGDTESMIAEVEIYDSEIGQIRLGDAVTLSAPALASDLRGQVSMIGFQVKKQTVIDADPAANTDARVVKVTVQLDDVSSMLAARLTNLQVTAQIAVGVVLAGAGQ